MVSIRFLDHTADCCVGSRNRRISLSDIYALRTHSLFSKIIRPIRSALNIHRDNFFFIFLYCSIMQKHRHIGFNSIPHHIADLQRNTVRIIKSDHCAVIPNANIQFTSITIGKGNDFFFYIVYKYFLQFYSFAFLKKHDIISLLTFVCLAYYIKSDQLCQSSDPIATRFDLIFLLYPPMNEVTDSVVL